MPRIAAGALAALALACAPAPAAATVRTLTASAPARLGLKAHVRRCSAQARVTIDGRPWALVSVRRRAVERVIRRTLPAGRHRVRVRLAGRAHCRRARLIVDRIRALPVATPAAPSPSREAPVPALPGLGNPLTGARFSAYPDSNAARTAASWRAAGRAADADALLKVAAGQQAAWIGDWSGANPAADVRAAVVRAHAAGAMPVLVAYDIPARDCGSYSAGGAASDDDYRRWIEAFASGIDGTAAVILEPDALAGLDCVDAPARLALLSHAVDVLAARPGVATYIDAGNAGWQPPAVIADRLRAAGIERAQGFSLNVSNFDSNESELAYGRAISALVGGRHFVIDTSRNGQGPAAGGEWCNPAGRGLGRLPTTDTGDPLADAFLWVKSPGESDGTCNGGPAAGTWWPEYALGLAQRAAW
jgi:endoglucanase